MTDSATPARKGFLHTAWVQLAIGVGCMAMIANLQYGWTLFVVPIQTAHHWQRESIQFAFTIFVATETWLVPIEAWFVDRYGPRIVVGCASLLVALAWVVNSYADSLPLLYLGAVIGGIGAGSVYGTCVGNALKWFPRRRGLAAGCTAAGFGVGAALTTLPIAQMIAGSGYETAFFTFGLGQGGVVFCLSWLLRNPSAAQMRAAGRLRSNDQDTKPAQVLRTPVFWLMYAAFVLVAAGGLTLTAQIGPMAHDYKIDTAPFTLFGLLGSPLQALPLAVFLDRILDGIGRPSFGWLSDRIGREVTMGLAFTLGAGMLILLDQFGHDPVVFVLASAFYFFSFGEIYSLFPATCGDTFGASYAATNAGMLYTAKGSAALLVPFTSGLASAYGWHVVFLVFICCNLMAAGLAIGAIRPMRRQWLERRDRLAHAASLAPDKGA